MRRFFLALALSVIAFPCFAQQYAPRIPQTAVAIAATSGNVAAATAAATLGTGDGQRTYICGYSVQSLGATAAATVNLTITGLGGTYSTSYFTVAGATVRNPDFVVNFADCLPASAVNTSIVVSLPSLGAGNTAASVNAWGYRF